MARYLVVGTGPVGTNHLKEIVNTPAIELVAVADTREEIAKEAAEKFHAKRFYTSCEEMFAKEKADCVGIFTPADTHCKLAMKAAEHGLHVITEKPFCTDVAEGRKTIETFRQKNLMLAVTFNYRFCEDTRKIKDLIDAGRIGKVMEIRSVSLIGSGQKPPEGDDQRRRWDRMFTDGVKGLMFDHGVHSIDLFRWYSGREFRRVTAFGSRHQGYKYPDACTAIFELEGGVKAIYDHGPLPYAQHGQGSPLVFFFTIAGAEGTILWRFGAARAEGGGLRAVLSVHNKDGTEEWLYAHGKSRDLMHKQFAECVKEGRLGGFFPQPEEALIVSEYGLKMIESAMANEI